MHEGRARGEFGRGDDVGGVYCGEDGGGLGGEEEGHSEQDFGRGQDVEGIFAFAVCFYFFPLVRPSNFFGAYMSLIGQ